MQLRTFLPWASAAIAAFAATCAALTARLAYSDAPNNSEISEILADARIIFSLALAAAIALGVPLFLLLRARTNINAAMSVLGGFVVGALPASILAARTLAGWVQYLETVFHAGAFGAVGGFAFFLTLRFSGAFRSENTENSNQGAGAIGLAALVTSAALLLPNAVYDRSCHNAVRDGHLRVTPKIAAELRLEAGGWAQLTQIFRELEKRHGLSFRDDTHAPDGTLWWRTLNLCGDGVMVEADHRPLARDEIRLTISQIGAGSGWNGLSRALFREIETAWPGKAVFLAPSGENLPMEEVMRGSAD